MRCVSVFVGNSFIIISLNLLKFFCNIQLNSAGVWIQLFEKHDQYLGIIKWNTSEYSFETSIILCLNKYSQKPLCIINWLLVRMAVHQDKNDGSYSVVLEAIFEQNCVVCCAVDCTCDLTITCYVHDKLNPVIRIKVNKVKWSASGYSFGTSVVLIILMCIKSETSLPIINWFIRKLK